MNDEDMVPSPKCELVPLDPGDGQVFTCRGCGHTETYVVLDGKGEWV